MNGKRGLGRGLGALIPTAPSGDHGSVGIAPANGQNQQHNGVQNGADTGPETVAGPNPYSAVDNQQVETGAFFAAAGLDPAERPAASPGV
jgi:hypothetical protein